MVAKRVDKWQALDGSFHDTEKEAILYEVKKRMELIFESTKVQFSPQFFPSEITTVILANKDEIKKIISDYEAVIGP